MNENEIINPIFKTRSIRATEDVLNKFKAVSEHFDNQSDCLEQLITAYEVSNAKAVLSDMKTSIADYESHITAIQKAFLNVLELNQNAENRIRTEYSLQLDSMHKTISSLQEESEQLQVTADGFKSAYEASISETNSLKHEISKLNDEISKHNDILSDKNLIISELQRRLSEAEELKAKNVRLVNDVSALQNDLKLADETINSTKAELSESERAISELKKQLSEQKKANETALEMLKAQHYNELKTIELQEREKNINYQLEIAELKNTIAELKKTIIESENN